MKKEIENIKVLCAEMVQNANSGHPGSPLGMSQFAYILYTEFLVLNPEDSKWINRDIVVFSNGHSCALQYTFNFLMGYLDIEDLKCFRRLNSLTPGHPEKNNAGIEISTGPLGQGIASSVGFALSSKILQSVGLSNHVYCFFGDGCYQEGISQEAFSLCSRLGLDNITFIYDYNKITIDGPTDLSMNENVYGRFKSLNFNVIEVQDNPDEIRSALSLKSNKPKVIILHSVIGKGSSLAGSEKCHGNPLGNQDIEDMKKRAGLSLKPFVVCEELRDTFTKVRSLMTNKVKDFKLKDSKCGKLNYLINNFDQPITVSYKQEYQSKDAATRNHLIDSMNLLQTNALLMPGCADLLPSINIKIDQHFDVVASKFDPNSYIHYGIREHAMFGIMNGLAAHGIFTPIGGTFLNFASYGLPSIRIACLDRLKTIYVLSHDSICLGEDGPTHQPIEVLSTLRAIPNLVTFRPCDGRETRSAVALAVLQSLPSALILSRQTLKDLDLTIKGNAKYCGSQDNLVPDECFDSVERGCYYLERVENHDIVIIASGSEVELAIEAKKLLIEYKISIVSMISFELFETQTEQYKEYVLDRNAFKVSLEALSTFGWAKYSDYQIGIDEFGRSAPLKDVLEFFGFTPKKIAEKIETQYKNHKHNMK